VPDVTEFFIDPTAHDERGRSEAVGST
jgi:hypothetical protein